MRGLTLLSFVLCFALASDAPAQGTSRGGRVGGGRGFSAGPRASGSSMRGGGSFFRSGGSSSASRAFSGGSGRQLSWRSNSSARSSFSRSSNAFRSSSGQAASAFRTSRSSSSAFGRTLGSSTSARGTGRGAVSPRASSSTLSPFARDLARSSSGSSFFRRGTGATAGSATTGGARSAQSGRDALGARSSGSARRGSGASRSPGSDQIPANTTARRGTGFSRTGFDGTSTTARRDATIRAGSSRAGDLTYRRYGYYPRRHSSYGYGYYGPYYCSPWYARSSFYLGFTFGVGAYYGLSYYYPWYHCGSGLSFAFFYGSPISYCYVPYGFYCDADPIYVTRYVYVKDTYAPTDYEVVEAAPPAEAPAEGQEVVEPQPAAGSPVAEKYLRDASEAFRKADYYESAKLFRLAALSAPENAAPLFALGQALTALGSDDAYAAKVVRKAVLMNQGLVKEPGDIVGVFKDQAEFDRVMYELRLRAERSPEGSDARFLLAAERYFSGDPKAVEGFTELKAALPGDEAVSLFLESARKRFAMAEDLPPVATPK